MSGAAVLLESLSACGVSVWFANPGTTELDLVKAFEGRDALRCYVGLQENVCTGAADGYGRMSERPAATLLHLGPGFANGIANLHNARRAHTPIINVIGDHTSWHLPFDAPLSSDIESLAKPVSGWVHRIDGVDGIGRAAAEAVRQTGRNGGQGVTLIFPADFQSAPAGKGGAPEAPRDAEAPPMHRDIDSVLARVKAAKSPLFLLGGGGAHSGLGARAQKAVARICQHLGAVAYAETFPARAERGRGLPAYDRLPYFPEPARAVLDAADLVVLLGALPPVTYFGYEGHPSRMVEPDRLCVLGAPGDDAAAAAEALADALGAADYVAPISLPADAAVGTLAPQSVATTLARRLPEDAIVSVEGGTCGYPFYAASAGAARHTTLTNTGGAIGQGLPVAMGAAIACPERQVVALVSDGSTQYTVQTLWSLAHENLNVVVLVAANHQYGILRNELRRGGAALGERAAAMTSLDQPRIDWVALASAYGVPAVSVDTAETLDAELARAFARGGPALIEMQL